MGIASAPQLQDVVVTIAVLMAVEMRKIPTEVILDIAKKVQIQVQVVEVLQLLVWLLHRQLLLLAIAENITQEVVEEGFSVGSCQC